MSAAPVAFREYGDDRPSPEEAVRRYRTLIEQLPLVQREAVIAVYRHAISTTFLVGSAITALAFLVVLFLPEHPLKSAHDVSPQKPAAPAAP